MNNLEELTVDLHSNVDNLVNSNTKVHHIIFIVDSSGYMTYRMEVINNAFEKLVPELKKIQLEYQSGNEFRISIMTFGNEARWVAKSVPIMDYNHNPIETFAGRPNYTKAFDLLDTSLSRNDLFAGFRKIAIPYIMVLTGRLPRDDSSSLDELLENGWFDHSVRDVVLIGLESINDVGLKEVAKRFAGGDERKSIINCEDATSIVNAVKEKTLSFLNISLKFEKKPGGSHGVFGTKETGADSVIAGNFDNPFGTIDPNSLFGSGGDFK